jgi:orotate phosphoribosyltransferase-like protein
MLSNPHLTPAQQRALALLSAGFTAAAAARSVGVHRNTVANWLRSSIFREALFQARSDQALAWREQAGSLTPQAIGAIQAILADPQAPAAVRLQAALAIRCHQAPQAPGSQPRTQTGRNQPCPCGSGRKFKRCCGSTH